MRSDVVGATRVVGSSAVDGLPGLGGAQLGQDLVPDDRRASAEVYAAPVRAINLEWRLVISGGPVVPCEVPDCGGIRVSSCTRAGCVPDRERCASNLPVGVTLNLVGDSGADSRLCVGCAGDAYLAWCSFGAVSEPTIAVVIEVGVDDSSSALGSSVAPGIRHELEAFPTDLPSFCQACEPPRVVMGQQRTA